MFVPGAMPRSSAAALMYAPADPARAPEGPTHTVTGTGDAPIRAEAVLDEAGGDRVDVALEVDDADLAGRRLGERPGREHQEEQECREEGAGRAHGVPDDDASDLRWATIPRIVADRTLPEPTDLLPHRPPFLFVDEILDLVPGEWARARWHVAPDAWFFPGHFPGNPILPGVIMIEALAQTGALAAMAEEGNEGMLALFAAIGRARFRRIVRPGEDLVLETRLTRRRGRLGSGDGTATVDGVVACQTELSFAVVDREEA
jgi:3-hydroxyacyl-[acyl-carrier-protein] dehydratase